MHIASNFVQIFDATLNNSAKRSMKIKFELIDHNHQKKCHPEIVDLTLRILVKYAEEEVG